MRKKREIVTPTSESLEKIEKEFSDYAASIDKLLTFDEFVLDAALKYYKEAIAILVRGGYSESPAVSKLRIGEQSLATIKQDKSLRPSYEAIYNQVVVIWVSVLAATLESMFKYLVRKNYPNLPDKKRDRKISLGDLLIFENLKEGFADIVLNADDSISFQDIGSIQRTFKEYFDIPFDDGPHFDNVAFAIMARHAIVHNAGRIEGGFRKYSKEKLTKRTVMKDLSKAGFQFELTEAKELSLSFQNFVKSLLTKIREKEKPQREKKEDLPF